MERSTKKEEYKESLLLMSKCQVTGKYHIVKSGDKLTRSASSGAKTEAKTVGGLPKWPDMPDQKPYLLTYGE